MRQINLSSQHYYSYKFPNDWFSKGITVSLGLILDFVLNYLSDTTFLSKEQVPQQLIFSVHCAKYLFILCHLDYVPKRKRQFKQFLFFFNILQENRYSLSKLILININDKKLREATLICFSKTSSSFQDKHKKRYT